MRQLIFRLACFVALILPAILTGQTVWKSISFEEIHSPEQQPRCLPAKGTFYHLDLNLLIKQLSTRNGLISIPLPDGEMHPFRFDYDPVMEQPLQDRFPEIATYEVKSVQNARIHGRIDHTMWGFHAIIHIPGKGSVYIDPIYQGRTDVYAVYHSNEYYGDPSAIPQFECMVHEEPVTDNIAIEEMELNLRSVSLDRREYRIAIATTAEYSNDHGGTIPSVLANLATVLNRTNSVFIPDVGVKMILIANNDKIIFFDSATDGFTNGNAAVMINENPSVLASKLSLDEYDVGHVFGRFTIGPAIGIAQKPSVCTTAKARGASNGNPGYGDPFVVQVFCHELGHQFSADHSFNKCDEQNENPPTGWEPGSGSTIMSYQGACGSNNIPGSSDQMFHGGNVSQMRNYAHIGNGSTCGNPVPTTNNAPVINWPYTNGFFIPISTPFHLEASATDVDGDLMTYSWEQMDTGPLTDLGSPTGNSPLFRVFSPSTNPQRYFPQLFRVLQNSPSILEVLPTYSRDMTFRFNVRDNSNESGGFSHETVAFKATNQAGPFQLTKFNVIDTVFRGEYVEVTWDVANTDKAPVNCENVDILLSIDGGFNYPFTLAQNVPNSGSHWVTIPKTTTTSGRIRINAVDNVFYNVNRANLRILANQSPGFTMNLSPYRQVRCIPETAVIEIAIDTLSTFSDPIELTILSGLPDGAVATFSQNPVTGPANVILSIDLKEATETGSFEIILEGKGGNGLTHLRNVIIDVYRQDYSTLNALTPASGSNAVSQSPLLTWVSQADAATYTVEVATSPVFGNSIIASQSGITGSSYQVPIVLDEGTIFYWRVIPVNICGQPEDVPVYAFSTATLSCAETVNATTYNVPNVGMHVIQSPVMLNVGGSAQLIRVKDIQGNHQNFGQLRGNLRSPSGKSVRLWNPVCSNLGGSFLFSINEDSPAPFECPPNKGNTYKSFESLTAMTGESLTGEWTFVLEDLQTGSGGQLTGWTLEYCSSVALNPPYLVNNSLLILEPGQSAFITDPYLLSNDPDDATWDIVYTLVKSPRKGTLIKAGTPLTTGDTFTQADINSWYLQYQHEGTENETDEFYFLVNDPNGGWYGIERFNILITNGVSVNDPTKAQTNIEVWPNPAGDHLNVRIPDGISGSIQVQIINPLGAAVIVGNKMVNKDVLSIPVSHLSAGMYFIVVTGEDRRQIAKVQISR